MKCFRYSLVCLLGGLLILCTGCQKTHDKDVVNTKSGIVINSSDFTKPIKEKVASSSTNKANSKVTHTGNVIHLGGGYEDVELGSVFRN